MITNFKLFENLADPGNLINLYAIFSLSQKTPEWTQYSHGEGSEFEEPQQKIEDPITHDSYWLYNFTTPQHTYPIKIPCNITPLIQAMNQFDFQNWIFQQETYHSYLQHLDDLTTEKHFQWHPQIKKKYPWFFHSKRSGII